MSNVHKGVEIKEFFCLLFSKPALAIEKETVYTWSVHGPSTVACNNCQYYTTVL